MAAQPEPNPTPPPSPAATLNPNPEASNVEATLVPTGAPPPASYLDPPPKQHDSPTPSALNTPSSGSYPVVRGDRHLPRRFGDYELLAEIARGGMGVIYLARQLKAGGRKVALKMILGGENASEQLFERFQREARIVSGIDHPGIVPIHEVGEVDGQPFYSMTLIEGGSLQERLQAEGPLEPHAAARLVKHVTEAVQYAHDHDIIHRDIKPQNILLSGSRDEGRGTRGVNSDVAGSSSLVPRPSPLVPKLTDFGLARTQVGGSSVTGELLGTPSYMAPEQASGKVREIGPASDVYSLGAVLYCVLTGRPPFQAANVMETMCQVLERDPVPPRQLNPAVPRDLETVCLKCLEKSASRRYASAQELADDLQRFLTGEPIIARPVGTMERASKWVRRRPAAAALLGVSALSLGLLMAGVVYVLQQQRVVAERDEALTQKELAVKAQEKANEYRAEAQRLSAMITLKNGAALCEEGDAGRGIAWMARSLAMCPPGSESLEMGIRTALASTAASLHTLDATYTYPSPTPTMAISPDGKTLLFGGKNPVLLDVDTGKPRPGREITDTHVAAAAFSPDGKRFAIGTLAGVVRIADASSGVHLASPITQKGTLKYVGFHPDGKVLLVATQFGVPLQCYDADTLTPIGPAFECKDNLFAAVYSDDGSLVATGAKENNASIWDPTTGKRVGEALPHPGVVFAVAISPDNKTLATGCLDGGVRLWELATGKMIGPSMRHKGPVRSAVFSRDGQRILTSSEDGTARLWDIATGRLVGQQLSHPSELRQALFNPTQTHILTAGFEGTARLWKLASEQALAKVLKHPAPVADAAFSPDGKLALTGCQESATRPGESRLWSVATGEPHGPPMSQQGQVMAVAFRPDGKRVLTTGNEGTARLWDIADSTAVQAPWKYGNIAAALAFSKDGKIVAIGGRGGAVQLREVDTGKEIISWQAYERERWLWSVAFTPDGKKLLTVGDAYARFWSIPDGKPIGQLMRHESEARIAVLSPDGTVVLTCGFDKTARLWSSEDQKSLCSPMHHKGEIRAGAFRFDGKVVATASADGTARLWEVPTGRALTPPLFHDGWVRTVAFSPDGKTLATGCDDGTARLWSASDGAPLGAVLRHRGPVNRVVFSPDGKTLLTASSDGTARLWTPPTPASGDPAKVALWVQVLTGMELDSEGTIQVLPADVWQQRKQQLQ